MAGEETQDPVEQAAQEAEAQLDELQHHSDEVGQDIDQTRKDWERRQEDSQVPGAEPHRDAAGDDASGGDEPDDEPEAAGEADE